MEDIPPGEGDQEGMLDVVVEGIALAEAFQRHPGGAVEALGLVLMGGLAATMIAYARRNAWRMVRSGHQKPPVHFDNLPGDVAGKARASEEEIGARTVFRDTNPLQRDHLLCGVQRL